MKKVISNYAFQRGCVVSRVFFRPCVFMFFRAAVDFSFLSLPLAETRSRSSNFLHEFRIMSGGLEVLKAQVRPENVKHMPEMNLSVTISA